MFICSQSHNLYASIFYILIKESKNYKIKIFNNTIFNVFIYYNIKYIDKTNDWSNGFLNELNKNSISIKNMDLN